MTVIEEIAVERRRQIEVEGWSAEHDDRHDAGDLAKAGASYAYHAGIHLYAPSNPPWEEPPDTWPWPEKFWKPKTPRRDLIRAAALIVAEIERLDRAAAQETP